MGYCEKTYNRQRAAVQCRALGGRESMKRLGREALFSAVGWRRGCLVSTRKNNRKKQGASVALLRLFALPGVNIAGFAGWEKAEELVHVPM